MKIFVAFTLKENMKPILYPIPKVFLICPDEGGRSIIINRKTKKWKTITVAPFQEEVTMFHTHSNRTGTYTKWVNMERVIRFFPECLMKRYQMLLDMAQED